MPTAGLSAAYQALRREQDRIWAKRQRELAEATGNPVLIENTERMIERKMQQHDHA